MSTKLYVNRAMKAAATGAFASSASATALENSRCGAGVVVDNDVLNSSVFGGHQHLRALEVCK